MYPHKKQLSNCDRRKTLEFVNVKFILNLVIAPDKLRTPKGQNAPKFLKIE